MGDTPTAHDAGKVVFLIKGTYDDNTEYEFLDVVYYNFESYVALKKTKNHAPTDTEYWQKLLGVESVTSDPNAKRLYGTRIISASSAVDLNDYKYTTNDKGEYYCLGNSNQISHMPKGYEGNPFRLLVESVSDNAAMLTKTVSGTTTSYGPGTLQTITIFADYEEIESFMRVYISEWSEWKPCFTKYVTTGQVAYEPLGFYATSEGDNNAAIGDTSHAEGMNNVVRGLASHVEGSNNRVDGLASHAEGNDNVVSGDYSHAEGENVRIGGDSIEYPAVQHSVPTTIVGREQEISWDYPVERGRIYLQCYPAYFDNNAHVYSSDVHMTIREVFFQPSEDLFRLPPEGVKIGTILSLGILHVAVEIDDGTPDSGSYGVDYTLTANYRKNNGVIKLIHEAQITYPYQELPSNYQNSLTVQLTESGAEYYLHAEEFEYIPSADYAHAEGYQTTAEGEASHASGNNTIAGYDNQFVCGRYNNNFQDSIFEVGVGTSTTRSTGFRVTNAGQARASSFYDTTNNASIIPYKEDLLDHSNIVYSNTSGTRNENLNTSYSNYKLLGFSAKLDTSPITKLHAIIPTSIIELNQKMYLLSVPNGTINLAMTFTNNTTFSCTPTMPSGSPAKITELKVIGINM